MANYSVFYLVGGSTNFICKSIKGIFTWDEAKKKLKNFKGWDIKQWL